MPCRKTLSLVFVALGLWIAAASAQTPQPIPEATPQWYRDLQEVPFTALANHNLTPLGQAAISIRPSEWKHAETQNFIYHYFNTRMATGVSVESEFYYRAIAHDLNKDTSHWERKAHIFIFDNAGDWKTFQTRAALDPWTGGIHAHGELFLPRYTGDKFHSNTLGHETAHLIIDRFYGSNVPLWLNEGYAEYISRVYHAAYYRTRGYVSRPRTDYLAPESYQSLDQLTNALTYPSEVKDVLTFYIESEKLVRFLNAADKSKFQVMLDALSKGSLFENALHTAFGMQFPSQNQLEEAFKPYATRSETTTPPPLTAVTR